MLATAGDIAVGVRRLVFRDKLALFLALATAALAVTFFVLLGSIGPSSHGVAAADQPRARARRTQADRDRDAARPRQPRRGHAQDPRRRERGHRDGGRRDHGSRNRLRRGLRTHDRRHAGAPRILGRLSVLGRADPAALAEPHALRRGRRDRPAVGQGAARDPRAVPAADPAARVPVRAVHADRRRRRRRRHRRVLRVHRQRAQEGQGQNRSDHVRGRRRRGRGGGGAARDSRLPE